MILVSFFSAGDALSNDVTKYEFFSWQGTKVPPFRFFGTPGIEGNRFFVFSSNYRNSICLQSPSD